MTMTHLRSLTIALTLGAATFAALPASAMTVSPTDGVSPVIRIASGGWAARTSGHQRTYDYGYGYGNEGYGWTRGPERYGLYGVENDRTRGVYDYGYGYDEGAY